MAKVACPCCDDIQLSAIPVETIQRAGEAGMSVQDLLTAALKAHQTCCQKGKIKGTINLAGLIALIQELEALIAQFIPGA